MDKFYLILLYILFCIPIRTLLIYLTYHKKELNIIYILATIGFLIKFFNNNNNERGFFNSLVWWNDLRFIHSIIYIIYLILIYKKYDKAYIILIIDLLIGIIGFINNYY